MQLRLLGKDPLSPNNGSPTIYETATGFLVQGWVVTDPDTLSQLGSVPQGETVVEIPRRMAQFFPAVSDTDDTVR